MCHHGPAADPLYSSVVKSLLLLEVPIKLLILQASHLSVSLVGTEALTHSHTATYTLYANLPSLCVLALTFIFYSLSLSIPALPPLFTPLLSPPCISSYHTHTYTYAGTHTHL